MKREVFVQTQFEGIHCWPEAPDEVAFLRNPHRHIFHVKVYVEVWHNDRELEFIMLKHRINEYLGQYISDGVWQMGRTSCEDVAEMLVTFLRGQYSCRFVRISVDEDGENGCFLDTSR